jgi:glucose/arabinose dehydrogenase
MESVPVEQQILINIHRRQSCYKEQTVFINRYTNYLFTLAVLAFCLNACTASTPIPAPPTPTLTAPPATPPQESPVTEPALVVLPTITPDPSLIAQPAPVDVQAPVTQTTPTIAVAGQAELLPFTMTLPPGFQIHYYAQNVPNARSLALGANGTVFVGSRSAGNVYALVDGNGDQQADQVITIARGLNSPNGVAFQGNALYVAEIQRIIRFDNIETSLENPPAPVVVNQDYPSDTWHGWKYLRFGPDGYLYVPVGAPCNVCDPGDGLYGTITRLRADGSGLEVYARGIRNTVGFDWDPLTGELWFTDNGHDELGDDIPPDELNYAPQAGLNFGFPYCHGGTISDPEFGQQRNCAEFTPPAMELGPHVAALGMRFYTGAMFPAEYHNQIFIAEHGSASRSTPIGYRITLVRVADGRAVSYETFAEGWLQNGEILGRPVDLLVLPDGSLLVSDDTANAIYRISY